jgi:hypothetical protein
LTDDPQIPNQGGEIPSGPRRKSRRSKSRGRDWLATTRHTPPLAQSSTYRNLMWAVIALGAIVIAYVATRKPDEPSAPVFQKAPSAKTGTSPAAIEASQRDLDARRSVAEKLFGPEIWQVKDWEDFDEAPEYRRVVEAMANLDPKFIEDNLAFSLNLYFDDVKKDPSTYRGQFVRMRGIVHHSFGAKKLDKPIAGRIDVYRGLITDPGDDDELPVAFFDMLDRPPDFDKGYEAMELDAVFFRTVRYETKNGKIRSAPWLIARTITPIQRQKDGTTPVGGLAVMTAFLALSFAIVYLVRRGRPKSRAVPAAPAGFRSMFERKLSTERPREDPPSPPGEA